LKGKVLSYHDSAPAGTWTADPTAWGPLSDPSHRDYSQLLAAVNQLLAVLTGEGGEKAALIASFEAAARGFGAQKALLLRVEETDPVRLHTLHVLGKLSPEQIEACERGESVDGVSPSIIQRVIRRGRPERIDDPRLAADAGRTPSLADSEHSVLCAPILDPLRGAVLAVVYFQNGAITEAYTARDLTWLEGYSDAVGKVFGFAFHQERQKRELRELLAERPGGQGAPEILGDSVHTEVLRRRLHEIFIPALEARQPLPILLLGERGTGKDLVARYLHAWSTRGRRPYVAVNCAEITDELAASRFFGHRRGAFTGALSDEPGFFRAADRGVLFLDEIAELTPRSQALLLRTLENGTVLPVGQTKEVDVDTAVILATHQDLEGAVAAGDLRADFYDRIRALTVRLLPLRERAWDIPLLLEHFRRHHEQKHGKRTLGYSQEALRQLVSYPWPGNVRELAHAVALLVLYAPRGKRIDRAVIESALPEIVRSVPNPAAAPVLTDGTHLRDANRLFQRELILSRLEKHDGRRRAARDSLGLTKTTFLRYLRALGIVAEAGGEEER
jgi:DNA-binding NtrC family response regulator